MNIDLYLIIYSYNAFRYPFKTYGSKEVKYYTKDQMLEFGRIHDEYIKKEPESYYSGNVKGRCDICWKEIQGSQCYRGKSTHRMSCYECAKLGYIHFEHGCENEFHRRMYRGSDSFGGGDMLRTLVNRGLDKIKKKECKSMYEYMKNLKYKW